MARAEVVRRYGGVSADERRAQRRRRLLDAAREVWGSQGAGEVTVRGVCAVAGLTPRYFYEQFENRDALLLAVADQVLEELAVTLVDASEAVSGDLGAKLEAALVAFFSVIAGDPHVHRILTSDPASAPGLAQHHAAATARIIELVIEHSRLLLDRVPPEAELRRSSVFAVGGVNALVTAWLARPVESPQEMAAVCTTLCLAVVGYAGAPRRGIGSPSSS